jgi:integrase
MTAMGRTRTTRNRDLEKYVKRDPRNGYITYRHPKMEKAEGFGTGPDAVRQANEVARLVNARLSDQAARVHRAMAAGVTFGDVLDRFVRDRVPELGWSASYRAECLRKIDRFRQHARVRYEDTDVLFFDALVTREFALTSHRAAISLLRLIDRFAVGKGLRRGPNVADGILVPARQKRRRQRIDTLDQFLAIRECAEPWVARATDTALISLQPREVLCAADLPRASDTVWEITRGKTGVNIRIAIGKALARVFRECRRESVRLGSRKLLARPCRYNTGDSRYAVAVTPDMLTRAFNQAVAATGLWPENPPTFHEIRSLGARLYLAAGVPHKQVQALLGHLKPETTEIYLETAEPQWIEAAADLEISSK